MPTSGKATAPAGKAQAAQAPARPFRVGVQSHEETNYDQTLTQQTSTLDFPVFELPPQGFLRGIYMLVQASWANSAATVAYTSVFDSPWTLIDSITLEDTNSKPIIGPVSGYDLYLINKYGGYNYGTDPKQSNSYNVDTGTTNPITIQFVLRLPIELTSRDALGALPNKSGTNKFRIRTRLAAAGTTTVFSTQPTTTAGSVRLRYIPENWWEPDAMDLKGRPLGQNPPAVQTTQYWTKGVYAVNAGDQRIQLQQGLGYLIRNILFVYRTTSDARSSTQDGNWPSPATLQFEANVMFDRLREVWRDRIYREYDLFAPIGASEVVPGTSGTTVIGGGRDYCVYPLNFMSDFSNVPGAETRRGYLATADASRLELRGNFGAAANLGVIVNYVAPARGDDASIAL